MGGGHSLYIMLRWALTVYMGLAIRSDEYRPAGVGSAQLGFNIIRLDKPHPAIVVGIS